MSKAIWKFPLRGMRLGKTLEVSMPVGAQIIRFAEQEGVPTIWAIVDPTERIFGCLFTCIGTGHPIPEPASYIGTFEDGLFVCHVFHTLWTGPKESG